MSFKYGSSCKNVLHLRFENFRIKCDCILDDAIIGIYFGRYVSCLYRRFITEQDKRNQINENQC